MFTADRIFSHRNPSTGKLEWLFSAREGEIGPYEYRETAENRLKEFIARCIVSGDDGGRKRKAPSSLSLVPMETTVMAFEPGKQKKGKESL